MREDRDRNYWQGRLVREVAVGWSQLWRGAVHTVMCHDGTVMLSCGVNIFVS